MTEAAPPPAAPPTMPPPPAMPAPATSGTAAVRPMGATVVTVISAIEGVLLILAALVVVLGASMLGGLAGSQAGVDGAAVGGMFAGLGLVFGIIVGAIAALYIAIAYGVWKGRSWAWMLGVVVSIIALVFAVLGLSGGISLSSLISLALPAIVLYFLFQPDVKRYLGRPA